MTGLNGIEVFVQSDENRDETLSDLFILYDNLPFIFEGDENDDECENNFEQNIKQQFSSSKKKEKFEYLKSEEFIIHRKSLVLRNFGPGGYLSKSGIEKRPSIQKILIKLADHDTNLEFKYEMSPLEILLESLSECEREKIFSKFHPGYGQRNNSFEDEATDIDIKSKFIKYQIKSGKPNPHTQNKPYEAIIKSMLGDNWKELLKDAPLKHYQLIELLSDIQTRYGYKLKSIFNRLDNELSFDLIPEKYQSPFRIPTSIDDIQKSLSEEFKSNHEESNQNPNRIPAILKELITYLLDSCDSSDSKALIKILPELFDKLVQVNRITPQETHNYYLNEFKKIGAMLQAEKDIFAQFAFKLQLKLISQKYRSISHLWTEICLRRTKRLSNKQYAKYCDKYHKQILALKKTERSGIDLTTKDKYKEHNKLASQVAGTLDLINNYHNMNILRHIELIPQSAHCVSDISIILRMIAHEKEMTKENKKDILEKFTPPVSKGIKNTPTKKLNAIERATWLSASSNKSVSNYIYRSHMHYWGLLFIHTKLTEMPTTSIKKYESNYIKIVGNVWKSLSGESDQTALLPKSNN